MRRLMCAVPPLFPFPVKQGLKIFQLAIFIRNGNGGRHGFRAALQFTLAGVEKQSLFEAVISNIFRVEIPLYHFYCFFVGFRVEGDDGIDGRK